MLANTKREVEGVRTWFAGMKKNLSKVGEAMERHGLSQAEVMKAGGLSKNTVSRQSQAGAPKPTRETALKIVKALNKLTGEEYSVEDFWG